MSSVRTTQGVGARRLTRSSPKIVCSTIPWEAYRGRGEIDRIAGELRATHLDFLYQPIAEPEEVGNGGRVQWVEGRPGEAPAYAGTDFIIARDGRIAAIYLFFDKLGNTAK
jgi:hypothetical protein